MVPVMINCDLIYHQLISLFLDIGLAHLSYFIIHRVVLHFRLLHPSFSDHRSIWPGVVLHYVDLDAASTPRLVCSLYLASLLPLKLAFSKNYVWNLGSLTNTFLSLSPKDIPSIARFLTSNYSIWFKLINDDNITLI